MTWNMAKVRSRQRQRKYKAVGPVGKRKESNGAPGVTTLNREWFGLGELTCCSGCGYHVCSCYDFVTWSDGSKHRCSCSGRGPQVFALDKDCRAHEHMEHPERFPDKFCATHKQWRVEGDCYECAKQKLEFVGGGDKLPMRPNAPGIGELLRDGALLKHVDQVTYPMWRAQKYADPFPELSKQIADRAAARIIDDHWNARAAKPEHVTLDSVRAVHENLMRDYGRVPSAVRVHPQDVAAIKRSAERTYVPLDNPFSRQLEMCTAGGVLRIIEDPSVPVGEVRWKQ